MLHYRNKISTYSREELIEEEEKLKTLLRNVIQEYQDRAETIHLLLGQLTIVKDTRNFKYEEPLK